MTTDSSQNRCRAIRERATGREWDILRDVAGILEESLDGRHHPCPRCGGTDRFRCIDALRGAVLCNQCFRQNNGDFIAAVQHYRNIDLQTACRLIEEYLCIEPPSPTSDGSHRRLHASTHRREFVYTDENDATLYRVIRIDNFASDGTRFSKSISQERWQDGCWIPGLGGTRLVPFRLPEILRRGAGSLCIAEGEKCAETLCEHGFCATTASGGANTKLKWPDFITDGEVHVFPDKDRPGREYALKTADSLRGTCRIKIISLSDLEEGEDVHDWFQKGHTADELREIITSTPLWDGKPLPSPEDEAFEWESFPVDALPEPLRNLVIEGAAALGTEESVISAYALVVIATVMGGMWRLRLKNSWHEHAIIWAALIAPSGQKKTPALDLAMAPLVQIQQMSDEEFRAAYDEYRSQLDVFEQDWKEWKRSDRTSPRPEMPEEPLPLTFWTEDTTTEAIATILQGNPVGIGVLRDELSGWFGALGCYNGSRGKDQAAWLSMHSARPLRVHRKKDPFCISVPRASVSICGGIQPGVLKSVLQKESDMVDSGLLARFLVQMPPRKSSVWSEDDVSEEARQRYTRLIHAISERSRHAVEEPITIQLSDDAKALFVDFVNRHGQEQTQLHDASDAAWSKLEGYAARIALILHACTLYDGDRPSGEICSESLQAGTMQAAIRIVNWFKREALRAYRFLGGKAAGITPEEISLKEYILSREGNVSVRDLQNGPRRYRTPGSAEKALENLRSKGILEIYAYAPPTGRPTTRYRLCSHNTSGDGDETQENRENNGVSSPLPSERPTVLLLDADDELDVLLDGEEVES